MPRTFPACPAPSQYVPHLPGMPRGRSHSRLSQRPVRVPLSCLQSQGCSRAYWRCLAPGSGRPWCAVTRLLQGKINTQFLNAWKISLTTSSRSSCDLRYPEKPVAPGLAYPPGNKPIFQKSANLSLDNQGEHLFRIKHFLLGLFHKSPAVSFLGCYSLSNCFVAQ